MQELSSKISKIFSEIYYKENRNTQKLNQLECWKKNIYDFIKLYYLLKDEDSKEVFTNVLRLYLGLSLSKTNIEEYSLYSKKYWNELEWEANNCLCKSVHDDNTLDKIETFLLRGYEYKNICKAEKGDYVLDCGAYTGNTSIYFSDLVSEEGKVFSIEAMPQTYNKLCKNISNYKNIFPYNYAIFDKEKQLKFTEEATPGSRVSDNSTENTITVQGISIDEFVNKNKIEKVDFIKMDIEGAELNALEGCAETCKKFSPKLAICIYHKADDWITIPKKILDLNENYVFYMKHSSNYIYETVLFAVCSTEKKEEIKIDQLEVKAIMKEWKNFEYIYILKKTLMYIACHGFVNTLKKSSKIFTVFKKKFKKV